MAARLRGVRSARGIGVETGVGTDRFLPGPLPDDNRQDRPEMAPKPSSSPSPRAANPVDQHVGSRMRVRRQVLGMSQEKLGDALGVTFQQVQKYERGTNRVGASRLFRIAQVLDVPVGFFFEGLNANSNALDEVAEGDQHPLIYDFISSPEGVALAMAVSEIKSKAVRRQLVDLARTLAKSQDD